MLIRHAALARFATYVNVVKEEPPFSNKGKLIDEWNLLAGVPVGSYWCCSAVHAMFYRAAGYALGGGASVQAMRQWARGLGYMVARPRKGDIACFDLREGDHYGPFGDHTGMVEKVLALRWGGGKFTGLIRTVEGNTSAQGQTGSQSNGGGVFRRWRWLNSIGAEFIRVPGKMP